MSDDADSCDGHPAFCDCAWHVNARHAAATQAAEPDPAVTKLRTFVERCNEAGKSDDEEEPVSLGTLRAFYRHLDALALRQAELANRIDLLRRLAEAYQESDHAVRAKLRQLEQQASAGDAERRQFIREAAIALWARSDDGTEARKVWFHAEMLWEHKPEAS
jgi:hypothetical protein